MDVGKDYLTKCLRKDCQLNNKGVCYPIREIVIMPNGSYHMLDLDQCPFYKKREDNKLGAYKAEWKEQL